MNNKNQRLSVALSPQLNFMTSQNNREAFCHFQLNFYSLSNFFTIASENNQL